MRPPLFAHCSRSCKHNNACKFVYLGNCFIFFSLRPLGLGVFRALVFGASARRGYDDEGGNNGGGSEKHKKKKNLNATVAIRVRGSRREKARRRVAFVCDDRVFQDDGRGVLARC